MGALGRLLRRARHALFRSAMERDMDAEMRFHVDMAAAERVAAGAAPSEARRGAAVAFGGVDRYLEAGRDARGVRPLDELVQDVRYGLRALRRAPSYAVVAALTLALGIGANTAIFSVVDAVLLRPLPYTDAQALVSVWDDYTHPDASFEATRARTRSYEAVGAVQPEVGFSVTGMGDPVRLQGARVSPEVFPLLRVAPALGRGFGASDEVRGGEPVVILSDELWRARFGGEASALGRAVELDGRPHTIVGIMPRGFHYPDASTRLWVPVVPDASNVGAYWGSPYLRMIGRLAEGVTLAAATREIRALAARLRLENPVWTPGEEYGAQSVTVPLHEATVGTARPMLLLLLGAVGLVMLVACANVANLALARGASRERELAVRAAIGAGRGRLLRQLLTESVLLATIGAATGLAIAAVGVRALVASLPPETPRLDEIAVNGRILLFAAAAAAGTGILFGIAPALRGSRPHMVGSLKEGGRGAGVSGRQRRLAAALVTAEIALAVVLATGAALLVQSFWRLRAVNPGFAAAVVSAKLSPPAARYADPDRQRGFYTDVLRGIEALPGVRRAAIASHVPFDDATQGIAMWLDGYTTDPNALTMVGSRAVSPGYLDALGIPLLAGRAFTEADRADAVPVAIIDRAMAERYWSGRDPIGGRMRFPWGGDWITIVGVVEDARDEVLGGDDEPSYYLPFAQRPRADAALVVATDLSPAALLPGVRDAVGRIDGDVPLSDVRTLEERIDHAVAAPRFTAALLLGFAALALVLGAIGVYGVVAYAVGQRTREFGVRMALGASRASVVRQVLASGGLLALAGVAIGLPAAFALARLLRGLLFGIAPNDPRTFIAMPLLLGAVALVAAWIPALRAARVEPMSVMRVE